MIAFIFPEYSWEIIEDKKAIDAYVNAQAAQDTADGKRRVFTVTPLSLLMRKGICGQVEQVVS